MPTAINAPVIPRDVFFGNPEKVRPKLSPDGAKLAYIASVDGCSMSEMFLAKHLGGRMEE